MEIPTLGFEVVVDTGRELARQKLDVAVAVVPICSTSVVSGSEGAFGADKLILASNQER